MTGYTTSGDLADQDLDILYATNDNEHEFVQMMRNSTGGLVDEEEADARKIQGNLPPISDDVVGGATTAKPPPEATSH